MVRSSGERSVFRLLALGGNGCGCSGYAGIGKQQDRAICACLAAVFGINGFREALTGMVGMGRAACAIMQGQITREDITGIWYGWLCQGRAVFGFIVTFSMVN
jgi:hypothetical protein